MAKSIFKPQYDRLRELLVESRKSAGFTQASLAECLKRPQSYVSKYERGERRLDVVEFLEIAKCVNIDGAVLLRSLEGTGGSGKTAVVMGASADVKRSDVEARAEGRLRGEGSEPARRKNGRAG